MSTRQERAERRMARKNENVMVDDKPPANKGKKNVLIATKATQAPLSTDKNLPEATSLGVLRQSAHVKIKPVAPTANGIFVDNLQTKRRIIVKNIVPTANAGPKNDAVVAVTKIAAVKPMPLVTLRNKSEFSSRPQVATERRASHRPAPVKNDTVSTSASHLSAPKRNAIKENISTANAMTGNFRGIAFRESVAVKLTITPKLMNKANPKLIEARGRRVIDSNTRDKVVIKTEPKSPVTLYSQLQALADRGGFITNAEDFECIVCMSTIEVGDGVRLRQCLHQFCYDCLKNAIMLSDEAEIPCPFGDGKMKCDGTLLDPEIRAILSADEYDNHLKRSLRYAEATIQNTIHCKLPDCDGWCICEDNVNQFACPKCKSVNCVSCQVSSIVSHGYQCIIQSTV